MTTKSPAKLTTAAKSMAKLPAKLTGWSELMAKWMAKLPAKFGVFQ